MKYSSSQLKQFVLACMWGDAFVDVNKNSGKARLDIYHSSKQVEYIEFKAEVLSQITGVKVRIVEKVDKRPLVGGGVRVGYKLQTNYTTYFYKLWTQARKTTAKQLVKPLALSVLWGDDGALSVNRKTGHYSSAVLCTDGWDYEMVDLFKSHFNKQYGWCPVIMDATLRGSVYRRLRFRKHEMLKLSDVVKSHTLESMEYKLLKQ